MIKLVSHKGPVFFRPDAFSGTPTVGQLLDLADVDPAGKSVSLNGAPASGNTTLQPGDAVSIGPAVFNG